jgi:hypothetical protein
VWTLKDKIVEVVDENWFGDVKIILPEASSLATHVIARGD